MQTLTGGVEAQLEITGEVERAPEAAQASVAITTDGGATWAAGDAGGFRSAVIWLSSRALLAVGSRPPEGGERVERQRSSVLEPT